MNFQVHNSYADSDDFVRNVYDEYGWLKDALGYFTAYRSTRVGGSAELTFERVGVGQGIFFGTNRPVFNTWSGYDFNQGICDSAVTNALNLTVQNTVFRLRLLFHHNSHKPI